jgi:peptidoglycan/xylan/chitin deacetylase (PgdA/CDA1 family)
VVLKVGAKRIIENDHRAYKRVPEKQRHQYFARIYWHTKYCLLQQYGLPVYVSPEQLRQLRQAVYRYGIFDIKAENLRSIDDEIRIIYANVTRILLPTVLRKIDEAKPKMPLKLYRLIKKITKRFYER